MSSTDDKVYLVAVDDGYAQTKLCGESPDGNGLKQLIVRSSIRAGRYGLMSLDGKPGTGTYLTEEGQPFTVSDSVEGESTQFDSFHVSPMNRVLVHHALLTAGYGGKRVKLIAGLPVSDFFREGVKDVERIELKRENLLKGIENASSAELPVAKLDDVRVGCQATAAFVDYVLDENLNERDVPTETIAVVDVGGRTTDIVVIHDGAQIDPDRSGTENIGVLGVYNALGKAIRTKFKTQDQFKLGTLDEGVRTGRIKLWGVEEDIEDLVAGVVTEQEAKIAREVERKIGSASNVDVVLFVGGGSALFTKIAGHFRNGKMAHEPEFANARGLLKYARVYPD